MQSRSLRVHAVTVLDTLFSSHTKWTQRTLKRRSIGTHVVHGDASFDSRDADFVQFGVTAEEIRWLQSGVVVPHLTVRPLRRRQHLRQWARRERRSRTRQCGAPGSVCAPVVLWAFTDICRLRALAQEGSGMSFALPPASPADVDAPSSSRALPPPPLPFRWRSNGGSGGGEPRFRPVSRVAPSTKSSSSRSLSSGRLRGRSATRSNTP